MNLLGELIKNDIDGKANISHTHDISNVTNLQPTLNSKLDKGAYDGTAQNLKNDIDGKANISHTHDISNVSGLQAALDGKQDALTEDNVGQFMDLELSTKSAPTSGDTVLAMDSVTGKAVKIPTDQLGGNVGTVDLTTKLDKGTYDGTAQNLKNDIDGKAHIS